jgi:hypothetical protein
VSPKWRWTWQAWWGWGTPRWKRWWLSLNFHGKGKTLIKMWTSNWCFGVSLSGSRLCLF